MSTRPKAYGTTSNRSHFTPVDSPGRRAREGKAVEGESSVLGGLIRKEILEGILSFKFVVVFLTSVLLILLAFLSGLSRYEMELQAYAQGQTANQQQMDSATDWADLGRIGLYVFRKPDFLSIFGDSTTSTHQSTYLNVDGSPRFEDYSNLARPLSSVLQELDFISVVKIALSLFALLFAYDAICGEKEAGTLQMILANSVSRTQVILGKIIGVTWFWFSLC